MTGMRDQSLSGKAQSSMLLRMEAQHYDVYHKLIGSENTFMLCSDWEQFQIPAEMKAAGFCPVMLLRMSGSEEIIMLE